MSILKKIITWILVIAIIISMFCVPVFASSGSQYEQKTIPFWDWFVRLGGNWNILGQFLGDISGSICPRSDDGYHHANSIQADRGDGYYECICSYCGQTFKAYESDLQQAYDDYTASLPATGYTSSGGLIWYSYNSLSSATKFQLAYYDSYNNKYYYQDYLWSDLPVILPEDVGFMQNSYSYSLDSSNYAFSVRSVKGNSFRPKCIISVPAPVAGSYKLLPGPQYSFNVLYTDSTSENVSRDFQESSYIHYSLGDAIGFSSTSINISKVSYASGLFYLPVYEIIPDSAIDTGSGGAYSVTTRPTTVTGGNYGIVGDDGQLTVVTVNDTIINETNNTYYNPATGKTETINSWTYDYSDRSYNVTLESGDTITVTYGDQNITIIEGGDTYIIYYIINDGCPGDDDCTHEWYQTGRKKGDCVTPEQRTYTCFKCGKQYTETDPVLGHSWHIIQTVSPKYDENGTLIQEGYSVYECERCGEQYKVTGDDDPVNSGSPAGPSDPVDPSYGHSWRETDRTEPLCTVPGKIEYICEDCGQIRTDVLPATGHTWQVERIVQTAYDDEGNLIQQGYTIYQCSVCGEQYKDILGTGPPGSSDDDDDGGSIWDLIGDFFGTIFGGIGDLLGTILFGIIGLLEAVLSKLLDALVALGEMIMGKLADVVGVVLSLFDVIPMLFGGFLDFLSSIFSFLPDEIMLLLTFGIAAVVFIGIIKAIRR